MKLTRLVTTTIVVAVLLASSLPAFAQGTVADYQRAMGLRDRFDGLTVDVPEAANWIEETRRFWYRKSVSGGNESNMASTKSGNVAASCAWYWFMEPELSRTKRMSTSSQ